MRAATLDVPLEQMGWASRKRIIDLDGLKIAYVEFPGAEPALLLVHGFTDTSRSFSLLVPHLTGRRLIIPDLRGHGASQAGEGCGIADFADDLAALVRRLRIDRPVLVGHSMGAMISIQIAARHPEIVGGLVLLAGTLKPDLGLDHPMVAGVKRLRDPISPTDPFYDWWHACRSGVPQAFLAAMARDASAMSAVRWRAILDEISTADLTGPARSVKIRAFIIAGAGDPLFGVVHQQALSGALANASLLWAQDCGHNPHWEDPAFVARTIANAFGASAE
ncbi:alpha/beta hydrolase [Mesorhizobium sp. M0579]|uniref:alpha/beta fold hydrolase n=1 Tax=Mesorhizobium sp. M0579 TaxID=2956962 RepID=UPI00333AB847